MEIERAEIQRRKVEEELRRSREELKAFVENASVGLHWVGPDGIIQWANAAECDLLGYRREEYVGRNIAEFHADQALIADILARLTRGERLLDVEARLKCKDGGVKTVLIDSSALWENGRFVHSQCFTRDITAHKAAERAAQHLAAIVESSEDAIISKDLNGIVRSWNRAAERLFGYSGAEMIGRPITVLIPPELKNQVPAIIAQIAAGKRVEHLETIRRRKDGTELYVSLTISPIVDSQGRVVGASKISRDITERKRAQEAIRRAAESNRYLAELIESSESAISGVDLDGRFNAWNAASTKLFGYAKEEILGQSVEILLPPDMHVAVADILKRVRAGESVEPYETRRKRKDGSEVWVAIRASAVKNADGRIIGSCGIVRDITLEREARNSLKAAKESLARSHEVLEERVRERTASLLEAVSQMEEFSYTVSHDLRAPLRGMQAYSKALLEDFGSLLEQAPDAVRYLKKIAANAQRLDRMILDVLTFSRMARSDLRMRPVKLDRLARELIEHYPDMQAPKADVRIDALSDVMGHEPSLTQVLSNLLTNAVKFVDPGTTPRIKLWTETRGEAVRLWVEDNGIGIEPEHHGRLFKMFERIHPDLPYEGTGVGLAIVRRAVERMGGKAGVESKGKGGSRFWIELGGA
jgi:PAS domain S-box-containing protein